jgi:selenocysteine lyase/cysteine desulfurase
LAQEAKGARVDWVPMRSGRIDLAEYEERIDDETLLVAATHAFYQNGFKQDLAAIAERAHARGALVFVDAYQTLGLHPVDVRASDVDFLCGGVHKFLMGIPGIAFLYVRRSLIQQLEPLQTGWFGRRDIFAFDPKRLDWAEGARRFEAATPPVVNAFVARAGIAMINEIGPASIRRWTDRLGRRLIEGGLERGLQPYGPTATASKTSTTAFVCPGDSMEIERALRARGVIAASRGKVIRLAPHFFSNEQDVDTALDELARLLPQSGNRR